jgi:hypothetical protein
LLLPFRVSNGSNANILMRVVSKEKKNSCVPSVAPRRRVWLAVTLILGEISTYMHRDAKKKTFCYKITRSFILLLIFSAERMRTTITDAPVQ